MKLPTLGFALISMASAVYGHMFISKPVPFAQPDIGHPDNSPLKADGSDFPCKGIAYTSTQTNEWTAGQQASFLWNGTAIHGGGSCQVALTTDKAPTKETKWKVIYAVEGGCPGTVETGQSQEFPFPIPKQVPNGDMVFAVTWFNKIGNPEMYMNCGAVHISRGSDDTTEFQKLPDMTIANIGPVQGSACQTTPGNEYIFPDVPDNLKTKAAAGSFVDVCSGDPYRGGSPGGADGAPQPSQGSPNNGQYTPPASQTSVFQTSGSSSAPPASKPSYCSMAPANSTSTIVTSITNTLVTVTVTGPAPLFPSTPVAKPSQAPSAPGADNKTCSPDGTILCNGPTQFGICDHGKVVWQSVAAGTKCENGVIFKRELYFHRVQREVFGK